MALTVAFQDGFDHYPVSGVSGTVLGFLQAWQAFGTSPGAISFSTGYRGRGKRLELGKFLTASGQYIRTVPDSKKISVHLATSFTQIDTTTGPRYWIELHDSLANEIFTIKTLPSQQLALFKGSSQLAATVPPITTQVAHRFNLAADLSTPGAADVQLWVDGDANKGFHYTGAGLTSDLMSMVGLCQGGYGSGSDGGNDHGFDDLVYCYDDAVNIGEMELITQAPISDVQKDWTPLTGTDNFAMVDDIPPDADTTYNSSAVNGNVDLQGFPALPVAPDAIFCISQIFGAKKEESGTRGFAPAFKGVGAEVDAATQNLSTSYDWYYQHYLNNPDTAAAWLASERAAASFGYKDAI